jgi:hypothetical protein
VPEHDPPLGRLAENAAVGDAAVAHEVARPGRVAAVLPPAKVLAPLGLLDLPHDGGEHDVAAQLDLRILQRPHDLDVAGERALHVRDPEPGDATAARLRLRLESGRSQPGLAAGIRRVQVPVEHEAPAAACAAQDADDVGPSFLDLLPRHLQAELDEEVAQILGHPLLVARRAGDVDQVGGGPEQPPAVDTSHELPHRRTAGSTLSPKSRI